MCWLRGIRGRSRREKFRSEKTREELGTQETVAEKIKKRRLLLFGHVERKGEKNRGITWTRGEKEKQRESEKDLYGQCVGRPEGENNRLDQDFVRRLETERSGGVLQEYHRQHTDARVKSCKNSIKPIEYGGIE